MKDSDNEKKINITSGGATHPVIEKIDDFIEHYYNGDYIIKQEAFSVQCSYNYQKGNLGQLLSASLTSYLTSKGNRDPTQIASSATQALYFITHIRAVNLITENPSLISKLKDVDEQNRRLKDNQQKLETEMIRLKKENDEFHKVMGEFNFKTVFKGEPDKNGKDDE